MSQPQRFSDYIERCAPAHYLEFYVDYEGCKELIRHLVAVQSALKRDVPVPRDIPYVLQNMLAETMQSLLALSASKVNERMVPQLVFQSVFRECLAAEIEGVNQFVALRYNSIQQAIRMACRRLHEVGAADKIYMQTHGASGAPCGGTLSGSSTCIAHGTSPPSDASPIMSGKGESRNDATVAAGPCLSAPKEAIAQPEFGTLPDHELHRPTSELCDTSSTSVVSTPLSSSPPSFPSQHVLGRDTYEAWRERFISQIERTLDAQAAEILHLDMYIRLNYKAIVRLANLFDKVRHAPAGKQSACAQVADATIAPWITANLSRELFANVDIDKLLIFISVAWNKFRHIKERRCLDKDESKWVPPESFVRTTTKYWIPVQQVIRTKLSILKHMPYLIFGASLEDLEAYVDPFMSLEGNHVGRTKPPSQRIDEGQLVSSIYFDSTSAYCYGRRVLRLEGAQLIRFRWYGSNNREPNKPIFIERKTHHESWTGESSTKERFVMPQEKVFDFMKGRLTIEDFVKQKATEASKPITDKKFAKMLQLGKEIQQLILEQNLQPMVRTSYQRAAFQLATSNDVRFSLDTNLCMVDEYIPHFHPEEPWCRLGEEILGKDQVVRFPYAVLEVKLQVPEQPPWVSEILESTEAIMVYKFSKFQHGMAFLHRPMVEHHGVPHWIPDFERQGFLPGFTTAKSYVDYRARRESGISLSTTLLSKRPMELAEPSPVDTPGTATWAMRLRHAAQKTILNWFIYPTPSLPNGKLPSTLIAQRRPRRRSHISLGGISRTRRQSAARMSGLGVLHEDTDGRADVSEKLAELTLQWSLAETAHREGDTERCVYDRSKNIAKIDPKSFFACERTFLHYLQKSLYLASVAIALTELGATKITQATGVVLGAMSIMVLAYSYNVFLERSNRIARRVTKAIAADKERLDNLYGPIVLFAVVTASIVFAVGVNIIIRPHGFHLSKHIEALGRNPIPEESFNSTVIAGSCTVLENDIALRAVTLGSLF